MSSSRIILGVDESGKGDFFGPLVIAGFVASESDISFLKDAGVRDGKKISNNKLLRISDFLKTKFPYYVVTINPEEYNKQYRDIKNLNKLLARGHARVIENICKKYQVDLVISDKFGKRELILSELSNINIDISIEQIEKGESVMQVAAASIISRAGFLDAMKDLSEKYQMEIPRGASSIVDLVGKELVELYGVDELTKVSKTHFKNYLRVINPKLI